MLSKLRESSIVVGVLGGIISGFLVGVYYSLGQADVISAVLFSALVSYVIVSAIEMRKLKDQLLFIVTSVNTEMEKLSDGLSDEVAQLSELVNDELHEVYLTIAADRYGDNE